MLQDQLLTACKQDTYQEIMDELAKPTVNLFEQATDDDNKGKNILHFLAARLLPKQGPVLTKEQIQNVLQKIETLCRQKALREKKANNYYLSILGNCENKYSNTPLHYACSYTNLPLFNFLLMHEASISVKNFQQMTPLSYAIQNGDIGMTTLLVQRTSVSALPIDEKFELMKLARKHENSKVREDIIKLLSTQAAKKNNQAVFTQTPIKSELHSAAERSDNKQLKQLLADGYDPDPINNNGETALHYCAMKNNIEGIRLLIDCNANVNLIDIDGNFSLRYLANMGNFQAVNYLAKYASASIINYHMNQRSILHILANKAALLNSEATSQIIIDTFTTLKERGADFNNQENNGNIPLIVYIITCLKHHNPFDKNIVVKLAEGVNLNQIRTQSGENILHLLSSDTSGDEILLHLKNIDLDILITQADHHGESPIKKMIKCGNLPLLKRVINANNINNFTDSFCNTPLLDAVFYDRPEIAEYLLSNGADPNLKNRNRDNAYDYVEGRTKIRKHISPAIRELLLNYRAKQPEEERSFSDHRKRKSISTPFETLSIPVPAEPTPPNLQLGHSTKEKRHRVTIDNPAPSSAECAARLLTTISTVEIPTTAAQPETLSVGETPTTAAQEALHIWHQIQNRDTIILNLQHELAKKNEETAKLVTEQQALLKQLREQAHAQAQALKKQEDRHKRKLEELTNSHHAEREKLQKAKADLQANNSTLQSKLDIANKQIAEMQTAIAVSMQTLGKFAPLLPSSPVTTQQNTTKFSSKEIVNGLSKQGLLRAPPSSAPASSSRTRESEALNGKGLKK